MSEHVYCVVGTFKMIKRVGQLICINFVLSLNKLFR